jgi:hypothetical protein
MAVIGFIYTAQWYQQNNLDFYTYMIVWPLAVHMLILLQRNPAK